MPLTQPKTDLAYLRSEKAKAEQQLRYYQHREKILEHQIPELTRKARVHRLCTRAGMLEVSRFAGFVFYRVFLGVVLPGSFVFNSCPAFSVTGAFQLEKMVALFFPQDVNGFYIYGASHVHGDFFSAFATGGTPAGGLVPVHGIVRRIAGFFTGGSGESQDPA